MTVRAALTEGKARLSHALDRAAGSPALDAELFLASVLGVERSRLIILDGEMETEAITRYRDCLARREAGEPAAYILGRREFRALPFTVSPAVLIPRPDTETLVEAALDVLAAREQRRRAAGDRPETPRVLDLCTGSGAVIISLKHERPDIAAYASDIAPEALSVARENERRLLGAGAVRFLQSDLFAGFPGEAREGFALIAANPPYVESARIPRLQREILWEPRAALDGGADGLALIRRIIAEAPSWLDGEGSLLLEADSAQMPGIRALLAERGFFRVQTYRDLAGRERVIAGGIKQ
ncbi:MAG: peptide chain release factor N(5)-glutamine methyltransferase [Spirochaetaceae bacterium]|jgi:release factor glutamine methyltransferase|nr:peptide chain release factor N(5)-glutamine methyltransferase [Spirochaetaceae bacterium]